MTLWAPDIRASSWASAPSTNYTRGVAALARTNVPTRCCCGTEKRVLLLNCHITTADVASRFFMDQPDAAVQQVVQGLLSQAWGNQRSSIYDYFQYKTNGILY